MSEHVLAALEVKLVLHVQLSRSSKNFLIIAVSGCGFLQSSLYVRLFQQPSCLPAGELKQLLRPSC